MKKLMAIYPSVLFCSLLSFPSLAFARGGVEDIIGSLLIVLIVVVVAFLICRELVCWYWKINETLSVLKEIRDLLKHSSNLSDINSSQSLTLNKNSDEDKPNIEILNTNDTPKGPGGPGHHWGENEKTHNVLRNCPKCDGIFHGDEFEICGECNCLLIDPATGKKVSKKSRVPNNDIDKGQPTNDTEKLDSLTIRYESIKEKIFSKLKNEISQEDELTILMELYRLNYVEIQKRKAHPEDLREAGAHVLSLLVEHIESELKDE